jgi:hypothetical protein
MEKKVLFIIPGIGLNAYGLDILKQNNEAWNKLKDKYGEENILELNYNQFLDSWTLPVNFNLIYFDPVRLTLNPFRKHKIIQFIERSIQQKINEGYIVDCLCHSQGCWVLALCNLKINKLTFTGSPLGFENLLGRKIVKFHVGKSKLTCASFLNVYSNNDFVGNKPIKKNIFNAKKVQEINSQTKHGLEYYILFLLKNNYLLEES